MFRAAAASPSPNVRYYCSSGGNAGLACATSALALQRPCTIVTPNTTPAYMLDKLRLLGACVEQAGNSWIEADTHMRENLIAHDPDAVYVPPFNHQHVWDGASTIVKELAQLPKNVDVHAIVASVGGGGLLNGLMQGVEEMDGSEEGHVPWTRGKPPTVVAVETLGANSLNASIEAGEHVTLPGITSIAISLGAVRVSEKTFEWAQRKARMGPKRAVAEAGEGPAGLEGVVVSDAEAAMACVRFADDARFVVEPSCGATIATCYNGALRERLGAGLTDEEWRERNVVLIVCGGSLGTLKVLEEYREKYSSMV